MVTLNMLRTNEGKYVFFEKQIGFVTSLGLIECLKQIDMNGYVRMTNVKKDRWTERFLKTAARSF